VIPLWAKEFQLILFPKNLSLKLKRLSRKKNHCTLWTHPKSMVWNHILLNFTMRTHFWRVDLHTWFFSMVFIQRLLETSLLIWKTRIIIVIFKKTLKSVSLRLNSAESYNKSRVNYCNRISMIQWYPTSKVGITPWGNARTVCRAAIQQLFAVNHLKKLSLCAWFAGNMAT
jgi:hypothetical protein